jgi:tetratricopeptide (TPR) repeat protein
MKHIIRIGLVASISTMALIGCNSISPKPSDSSVNASWSQARSMRPGHFLREEHEKNLAMLRNKIASAGSSTERGELLWLEASSLDSLGRSEEALVTVNQALDLADPKLKRRILRAKAGILFSLNRPNDALELIEPQIKEVRDRAEKELNAAQRSFSMMPYSEDFITATFCYMQLERWADAMNALADAYAPLEGPDFLAYQGLLYTYIMTRAENPSLSNAALERHVKQYAASGGGRYGLLLRMWQGQDTSRELARQIASMSGADQEDALAEVLFYRAAYLKFKANEPERARLVLNDLNTLAPYGSIEWIYGRRALR